MCFEGDKLSELGLAICSKPVLFPGRDSAPWGMRPLQRPADPVQALGCLLEVIVPLIPSRELLGGAGGSRGMSHTGMGSWLCCDLHTSLGSCCDHPWPCLSPSCDTALLCLCVLPAQVRFHLRCPDQERGGAGEVPHVSGKKKIASPHQQNEDGR